MAPSVAVRVALLAVAVLTRLPSSTSLAAAAAAAKPVTHTITIEGMQFKPADVKIKPGDSVVWVNADMFPHTVTSTADAFDSHQIDAGKSWKFRAATAGEFPYVCSLHPTMQGMLRVVK
jgi:plastocyanin